MVQSCEFPPVFPLLQSPGLDERLLPSPKPITIMLPYVLDETLVRFFNYWDQQKIQRGMQYDHELYTHLKAYPLSDRLSAYTVAFQHIETGYSVCITVSKQGYDVWRCLRKKFDMKNRHTSASLTS